MNKFLKLKKIVKYKKRLHTSACDNAEKDWWQIVGKWLEDDSEECFKCVCGFPEFNITREEYSRPADSDKIASEPYTVIRRIVSEKYEEPVKKDPVD